MAVVCEFIDVIVPIERIDALYPGGFSAFKAENAARFGGRLWHDQHLFRDGAMSPADARHAVEFWEKYGLEPMGTTADGSKFWKDVCVVESMMGGPTMPCAWIGFSAEDRCVWKLGKDRGETVGRWNQERPAT
jgi:hypothetical protein